MNVRRLRIVVGILLLGVMAALGYDIGRAGAYGVPTTNTLAYSGTLMTFGSPDNGAHQMSIALYVNGTAACNSTAPTSVTCVNGQFTVPVPSSCVPIIHQNQNVDVQLTIDSTTLGMTSISAVPYAVEADTASNAAPGSLLAAQLNTFLPVTQQVFLSGNGTYFPSYLFAVTSASATVGATYTAGTGLTFTVSTTISGQTTLIATGSASPPSSGTLTKVSGSGDATIAYSGFHNSPHYLHVTLQGGGAGGAASTGGGGGGAGGTGGSTTFGTSFLVANGAPSSSLNGTASPGATAAVLPAGVFGISMPGSQGLPGVVAAPSNYGNGGAGGNSPFGGAGPGGNDNSGSQAPGGAATANTGSGGGGSGSNGNGWTGPGGGSGNYVKAIVNSPAASYAYSVGSGGSAGTSGGAYNGGGGAAGILIVEEHY